NLTGGGFGYYLLGSSDVRLVDDFGMGTDVGVYGQLSSNVSVVGGDYSNTIEAGVALFYTDGNVTGANLDNAGIVGAGSQDGSSCAAVDDSALHAGTAAIEAYQVGSALILGIHGTGAGTSGAIVQSVASATVEGNDFSNAGGSAGLLLELVIGGSVIGNDLSF